MPLFEKLKALFSRRLKSEPVPAETEEDCLRIFEGIPVDKLCGAIEVLQSSIEPETWDRIRKAINAHDKEWLYHLYDEEIVAAKEKYGEEDFNQMGIAGLFISRGHFGFGMQVRNLLRESGYGEKQLGVANLDDCYVRIIEMAAQ